MLESGGEEACAGSAPGGADALALLQVSASRQPDALSAALVERETPRRPWGQARHAKAAALADGAVISALAVPKVYRGDALGSGFFATVARTLPVGPVVVVIAVALVTVLLGSSVHKNSPEQAARNVYVTVNFVLVLNYTIVILDSYDMCATLSMSEADSGRMVGNYMFGFCFGAACMWRLTLGMPDMWRHAAPKAILVGLMFQAVGAVAYAVIAVRATAIAQSADFANIPFGVYEALFAMRSTGRMPTILMASRFVAGFGSGWCQQFYVTAQLHLTPVQERPEHTGRWVFSGMLAIGLGPMVASILQMIEPERGVAPDFVPVGFAQMMVIVGALGAVVLYHPDLSEVEDHMSEAGGSGGALGLLLPEENASIRRVLIIGCLLMGMLRGFGVAAVEVVMASLLEDKFHWDQRATGVMIGGVFLCCIPLKVVHKTVGTRLTVAQWIRLLSATAILGCSLLYSQTCQFLQGVVNVSCAGTLVVAGVVLFPTFYLGESLACGTMHQHVLPAGSVFDGNHCQLYYNIAQGLGRFFGPWTSRFVVQIAGQNSFAMQQMGICILFVFIFESAVKPAMETDKHHSPLRGSSPG